MTDKDNKSKLTYHVWDKDNNEYDIPDEVVQQRGMDNFAKDFEGGYITMFDDKKQKVDVPIEDVGEYRKQGYMWYDTSGNATPINEVGKKPSPSAPSLKKEQTQYPQEVLDAYNSPDNKPGNFKDLAQLNDEYQRGELKKPGLISQALGMMPKVDAGNIGKEQKVGGMITNMLLGDNMQQPQQTQQPLPSNTPSQEPSQFVQMLAEQQQNQTLPQTKVQQQAQNEGLMDAKLANYLENWKQRPDKQGTYFENMVADLLADGTANSNEEAVQIVQSALGRYANRSAMDVTNQVVASLPDDTVQDAEKSIEAQWYSHGVQDKLKQEADSMGISYDDYVAQFLKPAMVQSLVQKYGQNYRDIAEGIATRLYAHDEHVQDRLMNQDINDALSSVINKYVNPSVVDEYNKAQEAGSKAFNEGMEGSQFIPANLRLGTALGAQYEANEAKDPAKVLSVLQKKFGNLYRNPEFLNDMSNAAFKVMQRYGLNGGMTGDPKQFKPMINSVLKNKLDQLEIKGMMPKGSAEYIMKTGLGNTIVGKITRKAMQTDYQNWLEDIANQQYQPGFWENVASGALTFAGDAWSYWLPGAAGGKLTKSMLAKAEGRLAGDLMAKGMESRMAARAAKLLIGKSKAEALKSGAVHGAVTFGGQSAISKPIDEVYRTGQFDENGKVYNPSVGKILANTLDEVVKQSAVGAIMQGGTIANMVGKGRGLATNILADVGGKVVDSSIMTGQQILERMAHDPNFKPTGKDAAESFLESMANLTAIGLPGMVGKYARFKDAREFNKKYDFTDQDIAELKRFGYDGLRDAFEKVGIDHLVDNSKMGPQSDENRFLDFVFKKDTNKYLEQNYMDLMNDPNVSEVLKAKMMAVVEGKRPSSFSPVVDSEVYKGDDGKYYLETYNKDGGVIDRKEYSSHDAARNDEKKLEHEKILNLASVLESELHKEYLDDYLYNLYNQAGQKYFMGEKMSDEEKSAVYLHQHAAEIGDIMQKRQRGYVLTDEEQKQLNAYRHFYNSVEENSKVMRDFVCTFEDSHGVARGTLRKALESNDKKYATLVESYFKELYNSIELKREMKQTENDFNKAENERDQESYEHSTVETEVSPTDTAVPEPPVSEGPAPYPLRTNSVPTPSNAEFAANPANLANENPNESKTSDAFVMGQNAYKNGDKEGLKSIKYNTETAELRLKRAFGDDEAQMNVVVKAYEDGKDMEQFVAQRANYMTPAQQDALRKYVEAMEANKGAMDALEHADDGYAESLKQQLSPYTMENGNIFSLTLTDGQRGYWKSKNDYGAGFGVFPDANGKPVVKQVYLSQVKEEGKEIPLQEYVNELATQKHEATKKNFEAMFDATSLKPNDTVSLSINDKDQPTEAKIVSVNPDGTISFNIAGSKNITTVPVEQFNKFQHFAQRNGINAELDAEDAQRAENEAIKAEAEKKQRFANGIVGLSDQKPDYSSKETDTKVAAEYLQEQYADNHDQLVKLVNGSRSDIKEQIDNIRKRIVEAEDWLDTNADLEPEQAQSREDKLKLAKEQLQDLTARYDNWNKIRSLIMTDEEKRDLKDERTANIKKVGIDKEALTVTDEREVPVLTDEELKKQYPAMDEASDYILSQRKEISKTQEELHRQLEDIDARLNQYLRGEADLTDVEIRDFNTTKADLEARQANLTESAKELKAQAEKLKKLYVQENKKERAAILAEMTHAEQRRVKAEQYLKDGNISGLMKLYGDTSVDFTDNHPNTVDEYVATSIGRYTLNYEGREVDGTFLNGLQQEFGGTRKDLEKIKVLAAEGKGQTFDKFVNELYDNLPDNLRNQGVNTQEIRNSLLALLNGAEKYSDLKNYILKDKIAKAEEEMRPMDLAEEEQRAAYEAEKGQQMQEQVGDVSAKYSLSSETAGNGEQFYQDAEGNIDLANVPQEVFEQIGYTAAPFRLTPKMIKHMMDRHNTELKFSSPDEAIDFVRDVMNNFDHVRLGYDGALVFSIEDGRKRTGKRAVTILINNDNGKFYGLKTSGYESVKGLEKRPLLWERGANEKTSSTDAATASVTTSKSSLSSEQSGSASHQGNDLLSDGKDTNNSGNLQENSENFSERLQNAVAETETEPTEAQKKAGNYKKGHLTFGGYNFTVETPKGVTRSGKDEQGKPWSVTMHDTYGYILGKIGVDGDHIDMFINDAADLDTFDGNVYVVDQVNPETGEFDEHKVMYGFPDEAAATKAYLSNYSKGWKGLGKVTSVPKATFDKWLESSDRKTKPFAEYAMIQQEEAKKAKEAKESLPFDAPMNMDDLPFHRDVKEVKLSEMTEAQKVAYDAVSTMLKKAGIPVKVVSNEDMEKVAEAQDNLNLAILLNRPEMRFKIKTPEEKQAAENAYNFAKELRPNKWAQYAVVDMSNPNKMPEYYPKQELARKERTYLNRLMWGNYKVFNLDKSFEDNVAGLTGSFPSEFDPYKIDEQTSKKNELKKQIKETEEAYKLTGQERKEYQNQLMKEYMDEHGLASENDIPDDVWNDCRNKSFEKYQDKLDSLFAKYKDLDRQLKAIVQPGVRFLRTYHGSGASFSEFDFDHMGEGEGSQAFGWGGYVTSSKKIGKSYATLMDNDPSRAYYRIQRSNGTRFAKKYPTLDSFLHGDKQIAMNDKFTEQEKIDYYNEMKKLAEPFHNLYEVDIPEDNGSNYLDWDAPITDELIDKVAKVLPSLRSYDIKDFKKDRTFDNFYKTISMRSVKDDASFNDDKAASKLLASLGYTGIKYKAGRNFGGAEEGDTNYVIFKPEDMKIVDHTKFAQGKGVVYGYTDGKEIVLNQEHLNPNTPIHEYQHLWRTAAKNMNPELIEHGDKLIMQTQLFADLKEDPNYKHLSDDEICDEAFARLTGEDGAAILEQMAKDAIKENPLDTAKELTIINRLKNWLKKFWYWTLDTFTKWKPEDIKKMTLEDIRNLVLRDLANGVDPRNVKSRMTKEEAVSLRKQMADNAEQERILEHTEENWLKEFGKDSRVTTPIGSIKLGENQYKKAGRNDRIKRFGLLKPTLERPDVILEKSAPKEGAERQTKYLFIKSFKKADGNKILNYESITVKQGEEEVAISAHQIDPSKVVKELTESKVLWNRFRGDSNSLGENQGSALTPSANNPSGKDSVLNPHSDAKIRNNIETAKGNDGNLSVEDKIKAVSQQFGVDEADVAMYANAIKNGSTAEAARARANIKRHLLQANEDKISSFKELLKYTKPVNEALKENFGDVDAIIEERKQQMEAQRNAMEAARKRAEEEEAKRKKHLEELSLIPDDKLDKQYMDALAKGDDATAREMLDEAARRKGYDDTESAYQGVGAWAAPGNPGYESDKARRDDWESSGSDVNLEDMALGYTPQPDDYFSHPERYSQNTPHGLESVKAINVAIDAIKNGEKDVKVKVYRAVPTSVKEGKLRNGDWVTPSKKYAEMHGANRLEGKYRIIEDEVPATQLWWDGNDANEFGFDDGKEYKYKNAKNNRKLNDLVTYDDEGDVIPPSKRFNSRKQDIRFHRVTEPEELDRLNKEKTFRMYSGMQEVDGKLYSPMAAIIDGKRTDATEIGAWMGADERPDLVKGGKFQLVKTDKNPGAGEGPVRAAYNPYMHTSTSMMNDQFTGAYARGNIKVVEWEIPESEKTSGYRAEGAKDAVGLVPWHSGSVNGLLPKDRQRSVMLSRWRKAVRVVPDSEVAESIAKQLEGTGLAIPWNVVTPNQLRELVKLGVPITTDESGQQAPETKEKFMAQMDELKKEFPQAQFVDVKMTKDAFKEWGKKANVKSRLVESFEKEKARIVSEAKEKGSYMLAPNGKKSKLDAEQWATVRTANFKKWFGDWENDPENASKVVDENGEPMVVYHGRSADFNTFEKKEGVRFIMGLEDKVKAEGFFFSPDRALAEEFAGNAARHRGGKANVVPCYLNIRKPMDLTGEDYDRIYEDVTGWDYTVGMDTQDNLWGIMDEEGMADKIKEKGYDGAIFVEEVDDNYEPTKISYCALDANQVKSADKNNGEFSSRNNDIRFRFGEPYDYEKYPLGRVEPNLATKEVKIVHADANHGFKDYKEAKNWAIGNICRTYSSDETGNKGEVIINKDVVSKYVSKAARDQSDNDDVHYAVLKVLPDVIREGIEAETHPNFNKVGNARKPEYGYDNHLLIHRVYGAVDIDGVVYRVKITMKENMQDRSLPNKPYSYEVTDISTKIEPLEAIDAQVQDHGSHSNDSISGTNLLKKVEMSYDKGKKLLDESEKMGISIENQRKIADSVVNTANKLGGAEATVYSSLDDVPEEYRPEVEQGAKGWYDPETHSVHVYLPNCEDGNDAQRTVFHEKIGHEGMEVLLGGEQGVRKFADFVYKSVGKETRGKILDFANKYDPGWSNPDRMNVGTQEYIAHLAEEGPKTAEDFSLWTKIKHYLIKVLKKLGIRVPGLLNDKDLRYYLMKAGKALHVWDNMPKEKQEAMMKQASNAEIKDSLGEGTDLSSEEDNKPKKKTERGRIDEATGAFKLAPNGEQSNLSKKQYIEARTKNFKDWFGGDWEKKPKDFKNKLDANGEPLEKYVEGYLNRPKKPTMPKKRKGEDEATFFGRKMLYSQALEDWPKTEADWKKRIDEFDENTLAALTPPDEEAIREKYQKQYENDMASWRKDHPKIKEGEERPLKIPDMRDYQSIQDYGEALGKHEIWKTAPNKDEYERMAEDEIISKVALMDAVQHPFSEYARLKAMKAEFQHMRHVMQNQKVYDQNTTDAVVQFAKRFMSLGYGDDLGRGSINTLLTIVKNSTGKKSYEISQHLYQVMDVLMNNQLRNFDRAVMKTMSIRELKENAKGIQVQGKLELRGQTTIKAFRDAVSSRISSDKLDEKISNLIDKMTDDRKNASSYQDELLGLNLAKQYVDYIDSSRNDAIEIEDLKKKEIEDYKNRKGIYKGELTEALLQEHVERLNQYDEALFNNKVERMDRYSQLLANLGGMIDESVKGAREFQERDARRAINVKMMASADLADKSMNQHHKENWKTRLSNSDVVRFLGSPLGSFDALMREFGSKQINGEGQLWNHFVRGAMKASNDEFKSVREANNEIDLKVSELFGKVTEDKDGNKKGNMILNDLYALERSNKVKSLDVTIRDIEGEQTYKLQQGNLMYIYMVNKMPDGAMKLRQMGILDADVERIKENIDPRFLKLADWIQGEFLPKMRTKYNKRHEELFGAPMPMVENYFPLRVLKNARYMEEDVNNTSDGSNAMPSTATGAIIKRKINKLPLDILNADALSVTIDNIKEMENWYNYAPIRKDANTLLSDTTFRNRVQNMTTIYGSGERLWNNLKDATAVAMGTYRPKGGTDLAVSLKNFGKGITGAKISGRLYTAFKQILSAPLFLPDADLGRFVRYSIKPYSSFKWAIENMPNFDKRWSGRKLGDTVLMDDPTDWKIWHTNLMEKAAYYGMTPNALVDAVTCAVGARAVFDAKYKQYIKAGLTEERAKEKALSDAEINFNTSQQSSEGAFVSPMQLDRTLESAIFTPFRNSSMLYERKGINALRNLKHRFEKGHKEASIKFMAGQLMEEGVGYEQATKAAEKMYQKGLMHNIADAIVPLWLGPIIWNLGGSLGYLLFGDDNEKKKKMVLDAVILGFLEGPVDGLAGGQFINTAIANTITSDGISLKGLKNVDFSGMPMLSDFSSMIEKFGYDKVAGVQDLMFMVMQSSTGFNPKTLTDAINACIDYGNGDMTNAKEIALFVFRLMNGPAATVDNLYIDELGMKGKDAKKLSYEELAKRYAEYKFGKNTFGLGRLYSDEEKQKKLKAIEKSFDKKVSERLAGMDREDLKNEFSESRSQKEKKLIGKIIADELETKDSEAVKKAKADASYLRQRNFSDLMDDLYLQKEWEATNEANAGLEELKGNGASEKEIEAYKTKHKADLDKRKAIQKARKEMQKKKADISSDNDEATMAEIRKLRDSILKTVRQTKK